MPGQTAKKPAATPKKPAAKTAPAKAATKSGYGIGLVKPMDLELPSGATCLAIRPGAQGLIKAGLLDSLDQLTSFVQVEHIDANDPRKASETKVSVEELAKDPARLLEGLSLINRVVCFVVKAPVITMPPEDDDEKRDPEAIYADDVDDDDKMFVFQWAVGGTSDLAQFRQESQKLMGSISAG